MTPFLVRRDGRHANLGTLTTGAAQELMVITSSSSGYPKLTCVRQHGIRKFRANPRRHFYLQSSAPGMPANAANVLGKHRR